MKCVSPYMTNATSIHHKSLAVVLGLALALTACSSSSSDAEVTSGEETATEVAGSQAEVSEAPSPDTAEDSTQTEPETAESKAGESETGESETGETEPVRLTDANPDDDIALFTITGSDDIAFTISSCLGTGESTVSFQGHSDAGTSVDVDATDMIGGVFIDGPEGSFEGSIDLVMVGDSGWVTVSGMASEADDSTTGGPMEFTINGFVC